MNSTNTHLKKLLPHRREVEHVTMRLICVPFAGGPAATYLNWQTLLPSTIDVCAVELPGHGTRFREPAILEMDPLIDYLVDLISPLFDRPVVIFGHSLGARVAFGIARRIQRASGLIVSAAPAAHLPPRRHRSELPRAELVAELKILGGTPEQVLSDDDLMDLFIPTIRADLRLLERGLAPPDAKVTCPIRALAARDDQEVAFEDVAAWTHRTAADFQLIEMRGGHFFVQSRRDLVTAQVRIALSDWSQT